ncbi:MAG: DNA polymerase I [Gemmataceae bacterium]|nr:DNA polymerase I [Gemmataceae bacterium]
MASDPAKLVVVDAHGLIFQVFHALRDPMSAPDGRPTNAVFGFTRDVFTIRDELKPDYLVFAFDRPGPTFRSKISPDYKAHRPPPPDDLIVQVPMIERVVSAFGLPVVAHDDFEADDVMATLARAGAEKGYDVTLCTSDKDCRQLLSDRVRMYNLRKRIYLDPAGLLADWGIAPEQVIDFQSLVGDSTDNIPGVPGIGPKTAEKLLKQFGSVANMLAHLDEVKPDKTRESIRNNVDKLHISRDLAALRTDMPIDLEWDQWKPGPLDPAKLLPVFEEFGFRGFAQKVRTAQPVAPVTTTATAPAPKAKPTTLFEEPEEEPVTPPAPWDATYTLIDSVEKFEDFVSELVGQKRIAFDLETCGLNPMLDPIVGIALTWKEAHGWYVAVRGPAAAAVVPPETCWAALKPILEDPQVEKVNQNIKFDMLALRAAGINVQGVAGDSMLADYLLRAGERSHNLDDLARRHLNHENISIESLIGKGKKQLRMDQVAPARVADYAGEDVDVAFRLAEKLEAELVTENLKKLYDEVEIPLISVLADMEYTGIRLDVPFLQKLGGEMAEQLKITEQEIHEIAGRPFNVASPVQLRKILFDELGLPVQKTTNISGASSTDQETLEALAALHPLPRKIVEYRQIAKLKGTYVDALPELLNPVTKRIHTSFNQTVASTGRLSSSDPNLQNIPARTDMGKQIRQAFLPAEGWQLLAADYSQIELRLLAHCSDDANLKQAFVDGQDIHAAVAARIFGVEPDAVSGEQRRMAKTVNFGVIYGISAMGLAARLGIDRGVASKFIDDYFARYPAVQEYQARLLHKCHETGSASTLLGRRRKIVGVRSRTTYKGLNQPEREAVNMEIQGSAADMMKLAMLRVHERLAQRKMAARMLLTVHDELVFEAPPAEIADLTELVRQEMITALPISVPIEVDVGVGPNWLDVE